MVDLPRIGALVCAGWALAALGAQYARARAYGRREWFAPAAGSAARGIAYAFGPGLSPAAKESVREHLAAYFTGVGYHVGVFAALGSVALSIADVRLAGPPLHAIRILTLVGALAGAALLVRRLTSRTLRGISCPDDFVANLLATLLATLAFARTLAPGVGGAFLVAAMVLFLYVPLGKIRHCFFFFSTRCHAGAYFGRRGVLPPARERPRGPHGHA